MVFEMGQLSLLFLAHMVHLLQHHYCLLRTGNYFNFWWQISITGSYAPETYVHAILLGGRGGIGQE